jgi:hypothetical protein
MKKSEFNEWISSAKFIEGKKEYDQAGNDDVESIYEKDGQFFKIYFRNGNPSRKWDKATKKWSDEVEEPRPVKQVKVETIEYR